MKSVDEVANSLLHKVYRGKAYYLTDMNGLLVLVSVATTKRLMWTKVDLFVLLAIFVGFVSENAQIFAFYKKIVPKQNNYFVVNAIIIIHQLF